MTTTQRNFRKARQPIRIEELTDQQLDPIRRVANETRLPQTVWPSRWFGPEYAGDDILVTSAAVGGRPGDAANGVDALLSVLPARYLSRWPVLDGATWHRLSRSRLDPGQPL